MITTVCLNPALDRTAAIDRLCPGGTHRLKNIRTDVGGKGINVALTCRALGAEAECFGLCGNEDLPVVHTRLEERGLSCRLLAVPGWVRVNLKVVAEETGETTEFNEPGPSVDPEILCCLQDELAALNSRTFVLTGSLPPGCAEDTYAAMIRRLGRERCVLDAGGAALRAVRGTGARLVKPNRDELSGLFGKTLETEAEVLEAAGKMVRQGFERVLVSLGGDGALMVTRDGAWRARAPRVPVCSTVGAGDAMLAGALSAGEQDPREMLRRGIAAGSAAVQTQGTQPPETETFRSLLNEIEIVKV